MVSTGALGAGQPSPARLDIAAFYRPGSEIVLEDLPAGTERVVARRASGATVEARLTAGRTARLGLPASGTYAIEARAADRLLAEELTTVGTHPGERPVLGFATSFEQQSVAGVLDWLRALRVTVVQCYDWMASYSAPLGPKEGWGDPLGRPIDFRALVSLTAGIRAMGAVAHAYAPVYATDAAFAVAHPELLLYRSDGEPERLGDLLQIADPGNAAWQHHFIEAYGSAADCLGFGGFHLDTYGYPRAAHDASGAAVDMRRAYRSFLQALRAQRPGELLSFNQVNGVPSPLELPEGPGFRYVETWPPNVGWRHFEALLDRAAGSTGPARCGPVHSGPAGSGPRPAGPARVRGTIACYPPVWTAGGGRVHGEARPGALRTVLCTEAVTTLLGAGLLVFGDRGGVLCHPYYPEHERLLPDEASSVLRWHRFALRCRDLFLEGEDTSWYEIGDENGAVDLSWAGRSAPEPVGGSLFARVVRGEDLVAVGVVDLSGSANGLWSEPTAHGRCRSVRVRLLLSDPQAWRADAAVLGAAGDRFEPVAIRPAAHREGRGVELDLPVIAGWSVLRLVR